MRPTQARRIVMAQETKRWAATLEPIPPENWPPPRLGAPYPIEALRSRSFLVQIFDEPSGVPRMTVNRAELARGGAWRQDISWDDLQRLKREAGYGDRWAVECYPADAAVVNVANMRHLWLLPEAPAYGWRKGQ